MYCLVRGWKSTTGSDRSFLFASPLAKFYARGGGFGIHSNLQNIHLQFIRIYDLIKKIRCIQCHSIGCLCQHSKLRFFVNKHLESRSKAKYNRVSLCRERFRDVQGEVGV